MDEPDGYPIDYVAEIDGPLHSQPPPLLPLSQLGSQTVLPSFSPIFPGALPDSLAQDGVARYGSLHAPLTAQRVGALQSLPRPPLGPLPPLTRDLSLRLPPLNYAKADESRRLGSSTGAAWSDVPRSGVPAALAVVAPGRPMRDADAAVSGESPLPTEPAPGLREANWVRGAAATLSSRPATPSFPPSVGSPSGGTPILPSQLSPPACTPLTQAPSPDALGAVDHELPSSPAPPSAVAPSPTNARTDPTILPTLRGWRHPSTGVQAPPTRTPTASNNATPSPASSPAARSPPGTTASPATLAAPQV